MPTPASSSPTSNVPIDDGRDGATIALESFGVRIGIRLDAGCDVDDCLSIFPPGWTPIEWHDLDRVYRIERGSVDDAETGFRVATEGEVERRRAALTTYRVALDGLESAMHHHIAEFSTAHLFVHAGVVGWNGAAIVLPGRSFAGKSTLVTALVHAGATYYSDEYAVLDQHGQVHAFPRRIKLRDGPFGPAGRYDPGLDGSEILPPLPVRLVAVLTYRKLDAWAVERLDGAVAIMAVCDNTVAIRRRPEDSFAMIGAMVSNATVIKGTRGDVDDTVARLHDLCGRGSQDA